MMGQRISLRLSIPSFLLMGVMFAASGIGAEIPEEKVRAVADQVRPALVRIHVVSVDHVSGREVKREGAGSGVIIRPEGYVVTNHHVAGRPKRLFCTLTNRKELEAELVGTDALSDIAVIRLLGEEKETYPYVEFGNSAEVNVGDTVLAMGCPYALSQSVTLGIISNTEMVLPEMYWRYRFTIDGEDVGSIVRWLGHDAPIYGGNSGGPLINLEGKIVGINEMRMGLAGAIPSNLAEGVAEALIEKGHVQRAWIGLKVQPRLGTQLRQEGALVSGALKDSPADRAGFEPGDLVVKLNGKAVNVQFAEELPLFNLLVASLPVGEKVKAEIVRGTETKTLSLKPEEREPALPEELELKAWGVSCGNLSFLAAKEMKRDHPKGVLVTSVRPGGPCGQAKPSLMSMDVILSVDGESVECVEDLVGLTKKLMADASEPVPVVVEFERYAENFLTVVEVGVEELNDPGLEARKAWVGVATQVITREFAKQMGLEGRTGVRVTQVFGGTQAEAAGLQVGDLIVGLDGDEIPASEAQDVEVFPTMVRQRSIGSRAPLTVLRGQKERIIEVELERSPKLAREMKRYRDEAFEFEVRDVAFSDRALEKWPLDLEGVLVESVDQGGWSALGHLSGGDLLLNINGQAVSNVKHVKSQMEKISEDQSNVVVFQVLRGIHRLYLEIKPAW